jgi:hypothetical protein
MTQLKKSPGYCSSLVHEIQQERSAGVEMFFYTIVETGVRSLKLLPANL